MNNFTSNLLKDIDNFTNYKIETILVNYKSRINSIKYMTGISIAVIVIFFVIIFSFDIKKFYKTIHKFLKNIHKTIKTTKNVNCVNQDKNVACVKINKNIDVDRKYLEFIKKIRKEKNVN
jgi:predicted PurR-regulated permease PerM